ncbi:MAG: hypothetical protein J7L15_09420 [Clostridiales bacterium]|nr:hypothetical protein [Clostridiales bacterium]
MVRRTDIETDIIAIVSKSFCIPKEEICTKTNFIIDLDADSLDSIGLVMKLEEKFDIILSNKDIDIIMTIENVVSLVIRKLEEKEKEK